VESALSLFVLRVLADDPNDTLATDDFALGTAPFDRRWDFHFDPPAL